MKVLMLKDALVGEHSLGHIYTAEKSNSVSVNGVKLAPGEYVEISCVNCDTVGNCGRKCTDYGKWSSNKYYTCQEKATCPTCKYYTCQEKATCPTCKYSELLGDQAPCCYCEEYDNWEGKKTAVVQDIASISPGKPLLSDPKYKARNDMFPAICKIWGIAWDNEKGESKSFSFEEYKGTYQLSRANGLTDLRNGGVTCTSIMLTQLLVGDLTIKKEAPFAKPIQDAKEDTAYLYVSAACGVCRIKAHSTLFFYLRKTNNLFALGSYIPQKQIDSIVATMKGERKNAIS